MGPRQGVVDALANASGSAAPQIALESPSARGPQADGSVEIAAKQLQGLVRTLMLALQRRISGDAVVDHPAVL
eukprot:8868262-Alexandrium_andersonii.AAC.1